MPPRRSCRRAHAVSRLQLEDLTDLLQTEQKLAQSERKFFHFADLLPEVVFETDAAGHIRYLNRAGMVLLGYPPDGNPPGGSAFEYFAGPDRTRVEANYHRVMRGEDIGLNEYRLARKDGSFLDVLVRSTPILEKGKIAGLRGFMIDVTRRKAVEQALQASERKFALAMQSSPNGFAITRLHDGMYLEANRSESVMTGYTREELIGRTSLELNLWVDPLDRARFCRELIEKKTVGGFETRLRKKDGRIRDCLFFASLAEIDGQQCVLSEIADITELRRTAAALRASEERLRLATEGASVGLWDWDARAGTLYYNDTYFRMLGYAPGEFTPSYAVWLGLLHPEDREAADRLTQASRKQGSTMHSAEYRMRCKDGSYRWVHDFWYVAEQEADGTARRMLGIHIDATARKLIEAGLKHSHEELDRRVRERTAELMAANRKLEQQIRRRRTVESQLRLKEKQLKRRGDDLAETNAALKVLLQKREEDQREIEDKIAAHLKQMVLPHVVKLRNLKLAGRAPIHLSALESNLIQIASPFAKVLAENLYQLTPTEMQVAALIRDDKSTKEIAVALHLSNKTIEFHRYNIRRKLGLGRKQLNLRSYLKTLK